MLHKISNRKKSIADEIFAVGLDHKVRTGCRILIQIIMVTVLLFSGNSCLWNDEPGPQPDPEPVIIKYTGTLEVAADDPIKFSDLEILSSQETGNIENDGTFSINSHESEKYQLFFITSKGSEETLFFGLNEPNTTKIIANDSITAIGLLFINPSLIGLPQNYREQYLNAVVKHPDFTILKKQIRQQRNEKKSVSTNLDTNPVIAQLVIRIMEETMQSLNSSGRLGETQYWDKDIEVIDNPGNTIRFKNWRHVFYAVEINNRSTGEKKDVLLERIEKAIRFQWWIPKIIINEGVSTYQNINDGNLVMNVYKWKWEYLTDNNAQGRASQYNTLLSAFYLTDMVLGANDFNKDKFGNLIPDILWSDAKIIFSKQLGSSAFESTLMANVEFLTANAKPLIRAFTGGDEARVAKLTGKAWNNIFKAITVAGWANEHIPFFLDLIREPHEYNNWRYSHKNGVLTKISENIKPYAELDFEPRIGYGNTNFTLKAVAIEDDFTSVDKLQFRWKIGETWTEFSNSPEYKISLSQHTAIELEVKDEDNMTVNLSQTIPFYESIKRTRIVVMNDTHEDEWTEYLNSIGYTNSSELRRIITHYGANEEYPQFQISLLNPSTDLLIFNPYAETADSWLDLWEKNQLGILNFVQKGGALVVILNNSSISAREIERSNKNKILPFKIEFKEERKSVRQPLKSNSENYDFLGEAGFPIDGATGILKGADIDHYIVYKFDQAEGIIHLLNEYNESVLVEKKLGSGIMMGAITAPAFYDSDTKSNTIICTNTIRYLVEE